MSINYLDKTGLAYLWSKIKSAFVAKETGKGLSTNDYTAAEKTKLSGLPAAGNILTVSDKGTANGVAPLNAYGVIPDEYIPGGGGYVLHPASANVLGGVKIGENITVATDGTISLPRATKVQTGVVRFGNGFDFDANGRVILDEEEMPSDIYWLTGNGISYVDGQTILFDRSASACIEAYKSGKLIMAKLNGMSPAGDTEVPFSVIIPLTEYNDYSEVDNVEVLRFSGTDANGINISFEYETTSGRQADVYYGSGGVRYGMYVEAEELDSPTIDPLFLEQLDTYYEFGSECYLLIGTGTGLTKEYTAPLVYKDGDDYYFAFRDMTTMTEIVYIVNTTSETITKYTGGQ